MPSLLERLHDLCQAVAVRMTNMSGDQVRELLTMVDYHGFAKARFPNGFLEEVARQHDFDPADIQLEVVFVGRDLRDEVHIHRESSAAVLCLNEVQHFPSPDRASAFKNDGWMPVGGGEQIGIPAGTPHGFTVEEGGSLYFLSVQSPPIVREDGHDDYEKVATVTTS